VAGEIPVHDVACAAVEENEDVQALKRRRHHDEEVAGEQCRIDVGICAGDSSSLVWQSSALW
jgi:hypothetical protein